MSTPFQQAREEGYSEEEITEFLSKKHPKYSYKIKKAREEGYSPEEIFDFIETKHPKEDMSKARSVASAGLKGLAKGAQSLTELLPSANNILTASGVIPKTQRESQRQLLERGLPTRDEDAEKWTERAAELLPLVLTGGESGLMKALQLAAGTTAGELARNNDIGPTGQAFAEAAGLGIPGITSAAGRGVKNLFGKEAQKLPSGLEKLRAVSAKKPGRGIITPTMQEKTLEKLDKQAAGLSKEIVQKRLPLVKQLEGGRDFEKHFENGFGELQRIAKNAGPEMNIFPLEEFLSSTKEKYKGLPSPHADAKKILAEVKGFNKNPQTGLDHLLKIYRSNNAKIRNIYETSRLTGKQKEFVDFLTEFNRNITKSFEGSLPENSMWLKQFKDLNKEYAELQKTKTSLHELRYLLNGEATPVRLQKFAFDPKSQKKLALSMGEEGASEITQIAKDLNLSKEAIKMIPAKEITVWDAAMPLSLFVPGLVPKGVAFAVKSSKWLKRGYGWFLATPERRKVYSDVLKAIQRNDLSSYQKSAARFEQMMNSEND